MNVSPRSTNPGPRLIGQYCIVFTWLLAFPFFASAQESPFVDRQTTETNTGAITTGKFVVYENRKAKTGKKLYLNFTVLHAKSKTPKPDPFFFFVGGPGQAATTIAGRFQNNWVRNDRDVVLLDQRGTAGDHSLAFEFRSEEKAGAGELQQFLDPVMDLETVQTNLERLKEKADLRMYSTPSFADDVNEFREAMGYDKINIMGGSYGTRVCLVYIRRHGETVRTATLAGCAPIEFRNPLYHAEGAQRALDLIFEEAASTAEYREAFGDLKKKFNEIVGRLDEGPMSVQVKNQSTGKNETVLMNREAFLAAVRFQMYYTGGNRQLPKLFVQAHQGNVRPFVLGALRQNMGLRRSLSLGMLLSVTSAEDVSRIDPDEVDELTSSTFFGDKRVRQQIAAAAIWPKSDLPDDYGEPVKSDVPTLILSGLLDPVTPPKWGEKIHQNFSNSRHVVVPTAHDIGGSCVDQIRKQFMELGSVEELDLDCASQMKLRPLELPAK